MEFSHSLDELACVRVAVVPLGGISPAAFAAHAETLRARHAHVPLRVLASLVTSVSPAGIALLDSERNEEEEEEVEEEEEEEEEEWDEARGEDGRENAASQYEHGGADGDAVRAADRNRADNGAYSQNQNKAVGAPLATALTPELSGDGGGDGGERAAGQHDARAALGTDARAPATRTSGSPRVPLSRPQRRRPRYVPTSSVMRFAYDVAHIHPDGTVRLPRTTVWQSFHANYRVHAVLGIADVCNCVLPERDAAAACAPAALLAELDAVIAAGGGGGGYRDTVLVSRCLVWRRDGSDGLNDIVNDATGHYHADANRDAHIAVQTNRVATVAPTGGTDDRSVDRVRVHVRAMAGALVTAMIACVLNVAAHTGVGAADGDNASTSVSGGGGSGGSAATTITNASSTAYTMGNMPPLPPSPTSLTATSTQSSAPSSSSFSSTSSASSSSSWARSSLTVQALPHSPAAAGQLCAATAHGTSAVLTRSSAAAAAAAGGESAVVSPLDAHRVSEKSAKLRKRRAGRLAKLAADYCLMLGATRAALHWYNTAIDWLKAHTDTLWLAGAREGVAAARLLRAEAPAGSHLRESIGVREQLRLAARAAPDRVRSLHKRRTWRALASLLAVPDVYDEDQDDGDDNDDGGDFVGGGGEYDSDCESGGGGGGGGGGRDDPETQGSRGRAGADTKSGGRERPARDDMLAASVPGQQREIHESRRHDSAKPPPFSSRNATGAHDSTTSQHDDAAPSYGRLLASVRARLNDAIGAYRKKHAYVPLCAACLRLAELFVHFGRLRRLSNTLNSTIEYGERLVDDDDDNDGAARDGDDGAERRVALLHRVIDLCASSGMQRKASFYTWRLAALESERQARTPAYLLQHGAALSLSSLFSSSSPPLLLLPPTDANQSMAVELQRKALLEAARTARQSGDGELAIAHSMQALALTRCTAVAPEAALPRGDDGSSSSLRDDRGARDLRAIRAAEPRMVECVRELRSAVELAPWASPRLDARHLVIVKRTRFAAVHDDEDNGDSEKSGGGGGGGSSRGAVDDIGDGGSDLKERVWVVERDTHGIAAGTGPNGDDSDRAADGDASSAASQPPRSVFIYSPFEQAAEQTRNSHRAGGSTGNGSGSGKRASSAAAGATGSLRERALVVGQPACVELELQSRLHARVNIENLHVTARMVGAAADDGNATDADARPDSCDASPVLTSFPTQCVLPSSTHGAHRVRCRVVPQRAGRIALDRVLFHGFSGLVSLPLRAVSDGATAGASKSASALTQTPVVMTVLPALPRLEWSSSPTDDLLVMDGETRALQLTATCTDNGYCDEADGALRDLRMELSVTGYRYAHDATSGSERDRNEPADSGSDAARAAASITVPRAERSLMTHRASWTSSSSSAPLSTPVPRVCLGDTLRVRAQLHACRVTPRATIALRCECALDDGWRASYTHVIGVHVAPSLRLVACAPVPFACDAGGGVRRVGNGDMGYEVSTGKLEDDRDVASNSGDGSDDGGPSAREREAVRARARHRTHHAARTVVLTLHNASAFGMHVRLVDAARAAHALDNGTPLTPHGAINADADASVGADNDPTAAAFLDADTRARLLATVRVPADLLDTDALLRTVGERYAVAWHLPTSTQRGGFVALRTACMTRFSACTGSGAASSKRALYESTALPPAVAAATTMTTSRVTQSPLTLRIIDDDGARRDRVRVGVWYTFVLRVSLAVRRADVPPWLRRALGIRDGDDDDGGGDETNVGDRTDNDHDDGPGEERRDPDGQRPRWERLRDATLVKDSDNADDDENAFRAPPSSSHNAAHMNLRVLQQNARARDTPVLDGHVCICGVVDRIACSMRRGQPRCGGGGGDGGGSGGGDGDDDDDGATNTVESRVMLRFVSIGTYTLQLSVALDAADGDDGGKRTSDVDDDDDGGVGGGGGASSPVFVARRTLTAHADT